jgi:mRNA-degrading endonuclease RelE of RelBE toxin-antitoxin system
VKPYTVYITPDAWAEIKDLPGNMRHRVKQAIDLLVANPRPAGSRALRSPEAAYLLYRLRLDRWRIVYAINDADQMIDVLAVKKRPPYDYGDLGEMLEQANLR